MQSQIKKLGDTNRVCPYEISRSALPFADVWVADYNYVFSPTNNNIFFEQPGFEPSQSLLIIDEGHNLPPRVADGYSLSYSQSDAEIVINELQFANISSPLYLAYEKWLHLLDQVKATDRLNEKTEIQVREYIDIQNEILGLENKKLWLNQATFQFYFHRSFSIIIIFLNLILFYCIYKRHLNMKLIKIILILIFSEILIGLIMFYLGFPFSSQPLHLFIATILFGVQFYFLLFFQNYNNYEKRNLSNT